MIIVKILGGLGNQMFQYAFAKALSIKSKTELKFDLEDFSEYTLRDYSLDAFNTDVPIAKKEEVEALKKKSLFKNTYIKEKSIKFDKKYIKLRENGYFWGYWQSEKYFKDSEDAIRKDFTFNTPLSSRAQEYAQKIQNANSISLHIRRGDYVGNELYNTELEAYYQKAVEKMKSKNPESRFFVFSDNTDYAKEHFGDFDVVSGLSSVEDMHLMSLCKHNIIANSSFSWWGAWLNSNPQKIVIAPKDWFKTKKLDSSTIIPENWTKI